MPELPLTKGLLEVYFLFNIGGAFDICVYNLNQTHLSTIKKLQQEGKVAGTNNVLMLPESHTTALIPLCLLDYYIHGNVLPFVFFSYADPRGGRSGEENLW